MTVTVVTVVYNCEDTIEETIKSVLSQTYPHIEYIIIDGASKDNTLDIINKYEDQIDVIVSEKDKGIYDAMNKAIQMATGEWINFMNAGDSFASDDVLSKIFEGHDVSDYDFIYGEHYWKDSDTKHLVKTRPLELMWQKICFSHQSLFSRTNLMKDKPYDLAYKIVCDYENYFSRYMEGKKFLKVDFPIAVFLAGGFSDINFMGRTKERYKVVSQYHNSFKVKKYYLNTIVQYYLNKIKKRIK
ncbi:hypothetical protein YH65_02335 [Sulfurovum lithotrophicum]|uniref:Glycosyltransferase 2-like domain-containing protein n=1 Tax=Sulfurovum lithotrophicum TaxID=206403 RepID=A0A7U4M035_9BACT|nr:glycosyltransferase family 2 protein [Sulfurovum lithotrophicum]AKF24361.1 hypothetical protein YH65_02335 [Sulfurovum lithotrophicum]